MNTKFTGYPSERRNLIQVGAWTLYDVSCTQQV